MNTLPVRAYKMFAVNNHELTERIASHHNAIVAKHGSIPTDFPMGELKIDTFSDGEMSPQFTESIREKRVFLIGSTNTPTEILKMILSIDAAKRASAHEVIAVIPYFGYSRQDRKEGARGAIGAKAIANCLVSAGMDRLVTIDLHADQIQGFFDIPVDHVSGSRLFVEMMHAHPEYFSHEMTICSPDAGGVKRAEKVYKKIQKSGKFPDASFALISKRRDKPNSIESMTLIGDVMGKDVIIVDDMVDTAGTLCKAAEALKESGAKSVRAFITHGVLSGDAVAKIKASKLDQLYVSNSIVHKIDEPKIEFVDIAQTFSHVLYAITHRSSVDTVNAGGDI